MLVIGYWLLVRKVWTKNEQQTTKNENDFLDKRVFGLIFDIGEVANLTTEDMNAYEASLKRKRDAESIRLTQERIAREKLEKAVKEGMEKGLEKGMEEGLEKGMKEGIQKGLEQGREEERAHAIAEKRKIALNLKEIGVAIQDIAKATGFSVEEIEKM